MIFPRRRWLRAPATLKWDVVAPWEHTAEISHKGLVEEQIEEWVDAAVGGRYELRDLDACVQEVPALLILQGQVFLESGQEEYNIVGRPHQKEHARYDKSGFAEVTPPLPEAPHFPHLSVAEYKNQQRERKYQDVRL